MTASATYTVWLERREKGDKPAFTVREQATKQIAYGPTTNSVAATRACQKLNDGTMRPTYSHLTRRFNLHAANRDHASRVRRRKLRQFFRAMTPRLDVKGVLRIETSPSRIAETVHRTDANRRSEHRHG